MSLKIRKAAVLGAGVMGAQIAAQLAAAGVRVYLLDLTSTEPPKDPEKAKKVGRDFRSAYAVLARENLRALKPSPLHSESDLLRITPMNFEDHWSFLAEVDWVIEAVVEKIEIKKDMHRKLSEVVPEGVPVTTNTSGIGLALMTEGLPESYRRRFFGTHFFNPPRYMKLVEVIPHAQSDGALVEMLATWIQDRLGKGIVRARDTVNFIGNRVGVFTIQATFKHMEELGLSVETVDALTGKLMGRPTSATFRTLDVVGLDTYAHVSRNVHQTVHDDPYREVFKIPAWLEGLIAKGALGQKSGDSGCYQKGKSPTGERVILAYRPASGTYETQQPASYPWMEKVAKDPDTFSRINKIIENDDAGAQLIWRILRDTISYSALLLDEIAGGDPQAVDDAIRWGFNWEWGPFELWQGMGYDKLLERMRREDVKLPSWAKPGLEFYEPAPGSAAWRRTGVATKLNPPHEKHISLDPSEKVIRLPSSRGDGDPRVIESNGSASLLDIGKGVACLVYHSRGMNAIDDEIISLSREAVEIVDRDFDALVIANDGANFCAGANLKLMVDIIQRKDWDGLDRLIRSFQSMVMGFKYASFPTVVCPHDMVLGGGTEVVLHGSYRLVAGETYTGLVEVGVGLLPAGGGTKELALRSYERMRYAEEGDPMPFLRRAFQLIGLAQVSTSGRHAVEMGLYPEGTTEITLSKDHQTWQARDIARQMADRGYQPPVGPKAIAVPGDPGIQTFRLALYNMVEGRMISEYDAFIGEQVATVLCGGEVDPGSMVDEQYFLDLERHAFAKLCKQEKTAQRIEHMLKTGKPLRN